MDSQYNLLFLGTGGGRFVTSTQRRRTAGIRIMSDGVNLHLDPGPGALVYSIQSGCDPQKLNGIVVSHCHPDHYTDAEVLIEAMTKGTVRKRGVLAAAKSVLHGGEAGFDRVISNYHQQMPESVIETSPGTEFQISGLRTKATKAEHTDPDAVGFRFSADDCGDFAYTTDTEYFEGIGEQYAGVRLLILCVMRPLGKPWKGHMTTDDAIRIVDQVKPEIAIITHLGMGMVFAGPSKQAQIMKQKTGVNCIAASDGMRVVFGEKIVLAKSADGEELSTFF